MAELLYRLGRFAARRRLAVITTWIAILVVAAGAFAVGGNAPAGEISIPGTPTAQVTDRLSAELPEAVGANGSVVFKTADGTPFTRSQRASIADLVSMASTVAGVTRVVDPFAAQAELDDQARQVADGRTQIEDARAQLVDGQRQLDEGKAQLIDGQRQLDEGKLQLVDGQRQLDEGKAKADDGQMQLDRALAQVRDGQAQLDAAKKKIQAGKAKLDSAADKLAAGQAQLDAARKQLDEGQAQLDAARAQAADGQAQLDAARSQLEAGQAQIDAARAQLVGQQAELDSARAQAEQDGTLPAMEAQFAAWQAQIDAGNAQLDWQQAQIDAGFSQISVNQQELDAGAATIAAKQKELDSGKATMSAKQQELNAGKATVAAKRKELNAGKATIAANQEKLTAGKATIAANQKKLDAGNATIAAKQTELDAGKATLAAKQQQIDDGLADIAANQAELDAAPARLDKESQKLETAATLIDLSSGVRLVSEDGSAAVVAVMFDQPQFAVDQATRDAVMAAFRATPMEGVSVAFSSSIATGIPKIMGPTEAVGLVIAGVVLLVMLGTLVAAGLPILTALIGVGIGVLGALSLSGVVEMVSVTPVLGVMLGLAVGIDYALFIVNRHRRQLKDGYEVADSIALANGTSGNAVVFAGSTVIIALLALNVTGIPFLGLMGTVGAGCVAIAVLVAITLTPALLSLAGTRVLRRSEARRLATQSGPAPAASARPMSTASAVARVVAGIALLALVAAPTASMRLSLPDGSAEAADPTQHQAYETVAAKFGEGANGPILVVADLPGSPTEDDVLEYQAEIGRQIASFDDVVAVAPIGTSADRTVTAFQVIPAQGPTSESTERLVGDLRAASPLPGGITIGVAGQATGNIDISQKLSDALPLYLAVVVGLSLLIMVVVFRSLLVPLMATGGFVLSLFAALGGLVAIFQWGWVGNIFGVAHPAPILNFLPTILVGILFGLAMDYMLFLASGMREAHAHGAPARTAVVLGFRAGRSVVIAAAIIMVSVFGGFIFSESAIIRPIGFALAFGVLVDAFVVRLGIMPALMHLAGDWAWWLPRWLDRLIPNVDVEGAALERQHPHVAAEHLNGPSPSSGLRRLDESPA